jgi:hypothetical protein
MRANHIKLGGLAQDVLLCTWTRVHLDLLPRPRREREADFRLIRSFSHRQAGQQSDSGVKIVALSAKEKLPRGRKESIWELRHLAKQLPYY